MQHIFKTGVFFCENLYAVEILWKRRKFRIRYLRNQTCLTREGGNFQHLPYHGLNLLYNLQKCLVVKLAVLLGSLFYRTFCRSICDPIFLVGGCESCRHVWEWGSSECR